MSEFKARLLAHVCVMLPIESVRPSPHHARVHNLKKRRKLERLLQRFGQVAPIIVDQNHVIVDGHGVHAAGRDLGWPEVMAVVVSNDSPAETRALALALNRIVCDAKWDEERLRTEFRELLALGFDLDLTGFEQVEIDFGNGH